MKAVVKTLFACSLLVMLLLTVGTTVSFAQEMTMKEYKAQLQEWADRERAAKDEIAKVDTEIESLKSQIADVEGQTKDVWAEIYQTIGVTEADVNAYRGELNNLESDLNALGALSPEDLFKRRKELDALEEKLAGLKENKISALTEMRDKIASLEGKISQLRAKMPKGLYDEYTVVRGDYLWRIAKKPDIYGDPFQWIRIYSFNRDQIKDPDLIYPDQIFKIQRESGPDEYLVGRGDNLSKIAGSIDILGDPTKWRQLYEANKDVIGDEPSLIYPYQVLKIPR
ncbi:MAG: LysM peptidoglycan-binding domain-containing protein [Calditrichaeota bacterium]|nr:MAG: LysM peptidoglycan-binding domain-containing protein [Calditrichota bacterium]